MVLYENSDIIQWGLRLLDGDPSYSPEYYGDIIQHDTSNIYDGNYYHGHYDAESDHIENDEMIARTLQEEFSQLDIAESSRYSQASEEHYHTPELAYGWHNSSMMNHHSEDHDYVQEGNDDAEHSSSCSSPCEGGEHSLELTDPFTDEVGRRLSQMTPIPHVPRINGDIPSIDEATSDHQRLLDRLQLYDFEERKVPGDGNCQFHALSDQLYGTHEHHEFVRRLAVDQVCCLVD
ncbi:OVARIAN TUMOR DOMAIN-containing deubiquitinating enzyme 10 isoform X2 [Prosopis cineraria]|uniref:OVARIAN TUMOR DOMAIN-containing deubiquitinating enzyme 10 isoform X2 n=1 Tax=Prosopis cineraria TaxID=364024 RepID=UPI00240EE18C|nr:OVARIAN TUMOR DOMAIN-containing deubiquitinating enzyme 10 isoform X2 [Prosopis cineraria]